jgi:DNA-binding phage protein
MIQDGRTTMEDAEPHDEQPSPNPVKERPKAALETVEDDVEIIDPQAIKTLHARGLGASQIAREMGIGRASVYRALAA